MRQLVEKWNKLTKKKKIICGTSAGVVLAGIILAIVLSTSGYYATTMRLLRVEGTVNIEDSNGNSKPIMENSRFQSGDAINTGDASLASIALDDSKIITLDENSRAEFHKKNKQIELKLTDGGLYFNVKEPLKDDETMDIKTSTMIVGIRGTSGYVTADNNGNDCILVTDGKVHIVGTNPVTGETKEIYVSGGQMVRVYLFNDRQEDSIMFTLEDVDEENLPDFIIDRLAEDPELLDRVCDFNDWDPQAILEITEVEETEASESGEPSESSDPEVSGTPTPSPSGTVTPTAAPSGTVTPTVTPRPGTDDDDDDNDPTPTPRPGVTGTPAPTQGPGVTTTPSPTPRPGTTGTPTPSPRPGVTTTPVPTAAPAVTSTPAPTVTPVVTVTPAPSPSTTPMPTITPVDTGPVYDGDPEFTNGSISNVGSITGGDPNSVDFLGTNSDGTGVTIGMTRTTDIYGNTCYRMEDYWVDGDPELGHQIEMECDHGYYYYNSEERSLYPVPEDRWP